MWSVLRHFRTLSQRKLTSCQFKRFFLSDSFACEKVWEQRLKAPILQKVVLNDLYHELEDKFGETGKISATDTDIFVNAVSTEEYLDEMEDVVHKLRLSSEATNIFESTKHAFIRTYLSYGDSNELMRILDDRLNYGIFPDKFCSLILMNHFIKINDFGKAAKVATLHMLQEDFCNNLIMYLSLFSCHKYLLAPSGWVKEDNTVEVANDDGEEVLVRVKYLRNPYFDNHFDLCKPNELIGKTFIMLGDYLNDSIVKSYKLLGYIVANKFQDAEAYIKSVKNSNVPIYLDIVELSKNILGDVPVEEGNQTVIDSLNKHFDSLKESSTMITDNSLEVLEQKIKSEILSTEKSLIDEQIQLFDSWENKRELALKNELQELKDLALLDEIKSKKEELLKKEEELFFFEKEDELDIAIENKRVPYPKKWLGKKKKKRVSGDYFSPEITKQKK